MRDSKLFNRYVGYEMRDLLNFAGRKFTEKLKLESKKNDTEVSAKIQMLEYDIMKCKCNFSGLWTAYEIMYSNNNRNSDLLRTYHIFDNFLSTLTAETSDGNIAVKADYYIRDILNFVQAGLIELPTVPTNSDLYED